MIKTGVGLIVYAYSTRRILTMEELRDKPSVRKKAGMFSFPFETVEDGEIYLETAKRLIQEEIGVDIPGQIVFFCKPFTIIPGTQTVAACIFVKEEFDVCPQDDDVKYNGWLSVSDLMDEESFVRVETRPVLKKFVERQL